LFIGAGDIGVCGSDGDQQTAQLADSVARADSAANVEAGIFTVGDNAYPAGLDRDFVACFGGSWGDPHKKLRGRIRPTIGNHDYQSARGAAYYRYFGTSAGPKFKGYYSFDIGSWHAIALNSEILYSEPDEERKQEQWLKADLAANKSLCTLAYFHRPLFSSGIHGPSPAIRKLWEIMSAGGVDLVLNGHEHEYERFLPQTPAGVRDSLRGITQIVVGTGGGPLTPFRSRTAANSAARIEGHWGILLLALGPTEFKSSFLDVDRRVWDPAAGKCH
jgi:hypothetical protein